MFRYHPRVLAMTAAVALSVMAACASDSASRGGDATPGPDLHGVDVSPDSGAPDSGGPDGIAPDAHADVTGDADDPGIPDADALTDAAVGLDARADSDTPPPECVEDTDCDDADPCTLAQCHGGRCVFPPGNDGAPCDNGDPCTDGDTCLGGLCVGGATLPVCLVVCGDGVCSALESGDPDDPDFCAIDCGPCGDGVCGHHEWALVDGEVVYLCPGDCLPVCGDGRCQYPYGVESCPEDCFGCGDGVCSPGESFVTCPDDCPPGCGDGVCEEGEDPILCPLDCMPACGDGVCHPGQDSASCPIDCPLCGDGVCAHAETAESCPEDCATACGDGVCQPGETAESCPLDCGWCGDGVCGAHESPATCPTDCTEVIPPGCGNGVCEAARGESPCTCPADCGSCSGCCDGRFCRMGTSNRYCGGMGEPCLSCLALRKTCVEGECQVVCGDTRCHPDETCASCPADCGCTACGETCEAGACTFTACDGRVCGSDGCGGTCGVCDPHYDCVAGACVYVPWCGDGTCDEDETCETCPLDCGVCPDPTCDDEIQNQGETDVDCGGPHCDGCEVGQSCLVGDDCLSRVCSDTLFLCLAPRCGDGVCHTDDDEDCASCPEDCGPCCPNGTCDEALGETSCTCPEDCGPCLGCCRADVCFSGEDDDACGEGAGPCEDCTLDDRPCIERSCVIPGDYCQNAILMDPLDEVQTGDTRLATNTHNADSFSGSGPEIWFTFVLEEETALVILMERISAFDTYLFLYRGACDNLELVAFNDDYDGLRSSRIVGTYAPGTYFVVATGFATHHAGSFTLTITVE